MRASIEARRPNSRPRQGIAVKVVIAACAASAGAHGGLVPEHLREAPRLGIAFILAAGLLLAVVAALGSRPEDRRVARVAALLLPGLIASWGASRVDRLPFHHAPS